MSKIRPLLHRLRRFLVRHGSFVLFGVALILLGLSGIRPDYEARLRRQKNRVERSLHKREHLAERYTYRAMQAMDQDWIDFDDMPDDIVLYCYNADTMKSWTHQFPISNDEVDVYPFRIRLGEYEAIVGGRHNINKDFDFNYHISVTDCPLPVRLGLNVDGTLDDMQFKLVTPKYTNLYKPEKRGVVSARSMELKKVINESL